MSGDNFGLQTASGHLSVPAESKEPYAADVEARFRADAAQIIARYPVARSALLPMLHLVQSVDGYITGRGIELCADLLGLSSAEVSGVATFYTQYKRHPNGTYTVGVCTNTLCAIMGGDQIWDAVSEHLGIGHDETTDDGQITLERIECNAACDYAPVVMANWEFFDNQTPDSTIAVVDRLRAGEEVRPSRGPDRVCSFREVSRVLAGFPDGRADQGPGAGAASLEGLKLAHEKGWTAPAGAAPVQPEAPAAEATAAEAPAAEATATAPASTEETHEVTPASDEAATEKVDAASERTDTPDTPEPETAPAEEAVREEEAAAEQTEGESVEAPAPAEQVIEAEAEVEHAETEVTDAQADDGPAAQPALDAAEAEVDEAETVVADTEVESAEATPEPAAEAASAPAAEAASAPATLFDAAPTTQPYGPGSARAGERGAGPEGWTIKGNANSMLFHTTESPWYKRTKAEVWFETVEAAQAAGFTDARERQQQKGAEA